MDSSIINQNNIDTIIKSKILHFNEQYKTIHNTNSERVISNGCSSIYNSSG